MIKVTLVGADFMIVKAVGSPEELLDDLARIKTIPVEDRVYTRRGFIVSHPWLYSHITAIKHAWEDYQKQLPLPM